MPRRNFSDQELRFVREAVEHLEFPSFVIRATNLLGKPLEKGIERLPARARHLVEVTSQRAIERALKVALSTLRHADKSEHTFSEALDSSRASESRHIAGTVLTGALGGFFGLPALVAELPVTTGIMLRSIARTAADFGEDIESREVQMECLTIFSLGGPTGGESDMESAYYSARVGLANLVNKAMGFVGGRTAHEILGAVQKRSAPPLVELLLRIASRFQIVVSEKAMGQLVPGIGAGAGALLNGAFADHFTSVARYHFGLKRLEREHGKDAVRLLYLDMKKEVVRRKKG